MNAPANLRTDAPLAVRLLVTHADDFGVELARAQKKLLEAEQEVTRIERARAEVIAAIATLGAAYVEPTARAR